MSVEGASPDNIRRSSGAESDASIIVGALYAVAADPAEWTRLVLSLEIGGSDSQAEQARLEAMVAGGEHVAQLAMKGQSAAQVVDPARAAVWILSGEGRYLAANVDGRASHHWALMAGSTPELHADRSDLIHAARLRLKAGGKGPGVISLSTKSTAGATFAYVLEYAQLPSAFREGLAGTFGRDAMAIVAPVSESDSLALDGFGQSFGLTPAEVRLATQLRDGASAQQAAATLNVSVNTVRNQIAAIFAKTGVNRQGDLIRALSDLSPLSARINATQPGRRTLEEVPEVETLNLPDGRQLAFREYGPAHGRPVLVFHGGLGASLLPTGTGRMCQQLGLRLIVPERPGIGSSDLSPSGQAASATDDVAWFVRELNLGPMQFCSLTSGARFALSAAEQMPGQVSRILMLSPRPPSQGPEEVTPSPMVNLQRRIKAHPWLAESLFSIARLRLSRGLISQIMQASAVSRGDAAYLAATPGLVDEITTAMAEALRVTSRGTAAEISEKSSTPFSVRGITAPITVWHGLEDPYASANDVERWLSPVSVNLRAIPGIGNYLILKHWHEALGWLAGSNADPELN